MLFLTFAILGILGLIAGVVALRRNRSFAATEQAHKSWVQLRRWSWLVSLALAVGSYFISFSYQAEAEVYRVLGFPFFAAAFDEAGRDYIGPLTVPAMIGNAVFFALLPHIALWLSSRRRVVA
jgi:hypothetical protein